MTKRKHIKVSHTITAVILIMQIFVLTALYIFVRNQLNSNIRENTINSMTTIVMDKATIVEKYMGEAEAYLLAYSRAGEITNLLKDPTDAEAQRLAQAYTERYGLDRGKYLEGIYSSEWSTHILTHTDPNVVGITTRKDEEPRKALQNTLIEKGNDQVYNTGIIISPATGLQIISMYKGVFDENGNPMGLVGAGIFTDGLKEVLAALPINGMPNAKSYLVNVNTNEFIFHEDETLIGTQTPYGELLSKIASDPNNPVGFVEVDGRIISYCVMPTRGWVFVLTDTADEIFATANTVNTVFLSICATAIVILTAITYIVVSTSMKPLSPIGGALLKIANCDVRENEELIKYLKKKNDLGELAKVAADLISALRGMLTTMGDCCDETKDKAHTLQDVSANLVDCVSDNIAVTQELSASLESVSASAENINNEIVNIRKAINSTVDSLVYSSESSNNMLKNAKQMNDYAEEAFKNSKDKIEQTRISANEAIESLNSLSQIDGMAQSILNITDQTNLLALNASIEAAHAGEAGKGFAVVADEIKALAANSGRAATNIQKLCETSKQSVAAVRECIEDIMNFVEGDVINGFSGFADGSREFSESANMIKKDIENVNVFVKDLEDSILQITDSIESVTISTKENSDAIGVIVDKTTETSNMAEITQKQVEENLGISNKLEELIDRFTL